jgi:hypothetical protein
VATPLINPNVGDQTMRQSKIMKEFMKFNPSKFIGGTSLKVAEDWISEIEQIARTLKMDDESKVLASANQLKSDAIEWWQSVLDTGENIKTWKG